MQRSRRGAGCEHGDAVSIRMAERKAFPLRLDPAIYDALQAWASGEMRSVNGQIEFLLRRALQEAGRLPGKKHGGDNKNQTGSETPEGG